MFYGLLNVYSVPEGLLSNFDENELEVNFILFLLSIRFSFHKTLSKVISLTIHCTIDLFFF